jgi:hypothetical protein
MNFGCFENSYFGIYNLKLFKISQILKKNWHASKYSSKIVSFLNNGHILQKTSIFSKISTISKKFHILQNFKKVI